MRVVSDFQRIPAFEIIEPAAPWLPLVFNSPHSGDCYPSSFLEQSRLDRRRIRKSEDAFVDVLFDSAPQFGAPLIKVNFPRAFLDVNREPYELDPRMFVGRLPAHANIRSLRVAGGLGTIARIVAENEEIYRHALPVSEALDRVETYYFPYHAALAARLDDLRDVFGRSVLVDCHSMPSAMKLSDLPRRIDVVVGDRYGTSADPRLVDAAVEILERMGLTVARNKPYAGGYITEHYGRPFEGVHTVQIEVNRGLYMDEQSHTPRVDFADFRQLTAAFVAQFAGAVLALFDLRRLAAE